jgi:quinoprotein glucose dehydrogenase
MQGLSEDDLIDFTPELRQEALEALEPYVYGPLFTPPLHRDNDLGKIASIWCPGDVGGTNIDGTPAADPESGILYVVSQKGCSTRIMIPGAERDSAVDLPTGTTIVPWAARGYAPFPRVRGLPIWKPPYSRITAIDMNTGEHLWVIPFGDAPEADQEFIRNHPLLQDVEMTPEIYNRGRAGLAPMTVTPNLLLAAGQLADNTPVLFGIDKQTGERLGAVEIPGLSRYGMSSWEHNGHQYIIVQLQDGLAAFGLPAAMPQAGDAH